MKLYTENGQKIDLDLELIENALKQYTESIYIPKNINDDETLNLIKINKNKIEKAVNKACKEIVDSGDIELPKGFNCPKIKAIEYREDDGRYRIKLDIKETSEGLELMVDFGEYLVDYLKKDNTVNKIFRFTSDSSQYGTIIEEL